jgi:hypothetical protein
MLSDATLRYAEALTTALLGLDACYAREQGMSEFDPGGALGRLVALNLSDQHRPDALASYGEARDRFAELERQAATLPEADRRLYYRQTCQSAIAFATWRESGLSFP